MHRRIGRVVEGAAFETQCTARYRGFESLILRSKADAGASAFSLRIRDQFLPPLLRSCPQGHAASALLQRVPPVARIAHSSGTALMRLRHSVAQKGPPGPPFHALLPETREKARRQPWLIPQMLNGQQTQKTVTSPVAVLLY